MRMSHRDTAPFFAGAECKSAARGRRRRGIVIDRDFECAEIAFGGADDAPHHRKFGHPPRCEFGTGLDQHGHVEVLLEQLGGFDRLARLCRREASRRRSTATRTKHPARARQLAAIKRRHFWSGLGCVFGPSGGFANIDECRASAPLSSATSSNRGASWVQAMTIGSPPAAALRTRSSSARQNCRPSMTTESRQARRTFSPSSGMVSSHEQIRMFRGRSAIGLINLFACPANSRLSAASALPSHYSRRPRDWPRDLPTL